MVLGNVMALLYSDGKIVIEYICDAWGNSMVDWLIIGEIYG